MSSHSDPVSASESNDELPVARPRGRVQVRSSTPPNVARENRLSSTERKVEDQLWEMENIPSTFELGESSNSPTPLPHNGKAKELTVPTLVARVYTHKERLNDLLDDIQTHRDAATRLRQGLGSRVQTLEDSTREFVARASLVMTGLAMMIGLYSHFYF
ncbi:hypothetical protein L1987_18743 [Smallanthus sonchifolius]|uniref:Uncharacterized protein n=1 Tax=Smallanthus sonchifolius TaxID=185202 RepID=A0ACB9J131_9ASTR|nr:hypothetical protein L1987_18743 [Smallanthus sonchifolius]